MSLLEDIIYSERRWNEEFEEYEQAAHKIDTDIGAVVGQIVGYVNNINAIKRDLEINIRYIYNFLKDFGNPEALPNYTSFKPEYIPEYHPAPYKLTQNTMRYSNDSSIPSSGLKQGLKVAGNTLLYTGSKFSKKTLSDYHTDIINSKGKEKTEQDNDIHAREEILDTFKLKLEIAKCYHDIISLVKETVDRVIITEIPGIKAFLYAQGVWDAVSSDRLPSTAKPAPIKRFLRSQAYSRHVNFIKNTNDFYTLFVRYYQNDYLTQLFNEENLSSVTSDLNKFTNHKTSLKSNSVFGGQNG